MHDASAHLHAQHDPSHRVFAVGAAHIPALAPLLAEAFDVDSAYRYLFPDPAMRLHGLSDFFAGNLRTHLSYACSHVLESNGAAAATVTLRPPGGVHVSALTMLRHGLLPFAFDHGFGAVKRLLWLKAAYDQLESEIARGQPHWYVHMMAVRPDLQGQSLGSQLLTRMLAQTADRQPELATVLATHLPRNLPFYRRAGFELVDERQLHPPDAAPYPVWSMRRVLT